jgi:hypothetical protein
VQGNTLFGNTSFIGSRGPNCSASDSTPTSAAFIIDEANVTVTTVQSGFQSVQDAKGLTCVLPPDGGDYWPYGGNPIPDNFTPPLPMQTSTSASTPPSAGRHNSAVVKAALAAGITIGVIAIIVAALLVRRWALNHQLARSVSKRKKHAGKAKR